jgi:hypothetical protein
VLVVGESDIGVVDVVVGRPELLTLLERHVLAVTLSARVRDDVRWPRDVVLQLGHWRKLAQERHRWQGGRHAVAVAVHRAAWQRLGFVFIFFSQDDIFMAQALEDLPVVHAGATTAHPRRPRAFAINAGAEAQTLAASI